MRLHRLWLDTLSADSEGSTATSRFCCLGFFHLPSTSSGSATFFYTLSLLTLLYALLVAFTPLHAALSALGLVCTAGTWLLFSWVVLADPGILPRHVSTFLPELRGPEVLGGSHLLTPSVLLASTGAQVEVAFCVHCRVWRLPGAHHCRQCGWCVRGLSHHCALLGVCIGARTHAAFLALQALLLATHLLCLGHAIAALALAGSALTPAQAPAVACIPAYLWALAQSCALVCGTRVARPAAAAAAAASSPCCTAPLVDFTAPVQPLLAAIEAARAAAAAEGCSSSRQPPAGSWEATCWEAMHDSLGSTSRVALALSIAGRVPLAVAPKGVLTGPCSFLPEGLLAAERLWPEGAGSAATGTGGGARQ
jgi:hypothetical protein